MSLKDFFWEALEWVRKDRRHSLAAIVLLFSVFAWAAGLLGEFVVLVSAVVAVFVAFIVGEYELGKFGVEFVMFTVVIAASQLSPMDAFWIGGLLVSVHFVVSRNLGPYVFYCVPAMACVGYVASVAFSDAWFGGDVFLIGTLVCFIYDAAGVTIGSMLFNDFPKELIWGGTNFLLNALLFWKVAPIVFVFL